MADSALLFEAEESRIRRQVYITQESDNVGVTWSYFEKEERKQMAAKVRPLHDRVLVERTEVDDQKSSGGIIIPDTAKEKPQRGKVIAVGAGKIGDDGKRIALDVKKGDEVLFSKYAGNDIKIDDTEYLIMREDDILAIVG